MNLKGRREIKYVVLVVAALALAVLLFQLPSSGTGSSATQEEKRIAEVLGTIAGAGKVEVALFYVQEAEGLLGGGSTASRPTGAVIVAEGANDLSVRLALIRAVRTLLGLPESAVDVFVMEEEKR